MFLGHSIHVQLKCDMKREPFAHTHTRTHTASMYATPLHNLRLIDAISIYLRSNYQMVRRSNKHSRTEHFFTFYSSVIGLISLSGLERLLVFHAMLNVIRSILTISKSAFQVPFPPGQTTKLPNTSCHPVHLFSCRGRKQRHRQRVRF